MDIYIQEKLADSTSSSDMLSRFEPFHSAGRLRKLSNQPRIDNYTSQPLKTVLPGRALPRHKMQQQHQAKLSLNFESEFTLLNDGNSFYRLVGIEHLQHMVRRPEALQQLCDVVARRDFDLRSLRNVPKEFEQILQKEQLPQLFRHIIEDLSQLSNSLFAQSLINLMEQDKKVDFAIVVTYRLYTYIVGYRYINGDPMSILLKGDEEEVILTYGREVTHMVIKLIAQSLSTRINLYVLLDGEMQPIRFGLDFSDYHNFELWVKLVENHYSLLVPKQHEIITPLQFTKNQSNKGVQEKQSLSTIISKHLQVNYQILLDSGFDEDFFQQIYERMSESERRNAVMQCLRQNYSIIRY